MLQKICLALLLSFVGLVVSAQTGRVAGKILNNKNEPLAGVSVKVSGTPGGTTTDLEGRYSFTLASGKTYTLTFSAVGYSPKTIDDVRIDAVQTFELDVTLEVADNSLNTVTVTGTRASARRDR